VRFEVPEANVATVLRVGGATPDDAPASTPALRREADERRVAIALDGPGRATLVVPIQRRDGAQGARGYVTTSVDLAPLGEDLARLAAARFDGQARLVVVDADLRALAAFGLPDAASGADASRLPVWSALPPGARPREHLGVVVEHEEGGERMVGAVESVPRFGWTVALWRPEAVAYEALGRLERLAAAVAGGALALALAAALLASRAVTTPVLRLAEQAKLIGRRRFRDLALPKARADELGDLARSMDEMAQDLEKVEAEIAREARLRGDLGRFLSKDLVESIVRGEHPLALGGRRQAVSVLFADVVAFTPLAEERPAEEVVALLNELFSVLSEVVFRHGGTVDKFIGDCLMAVWGAPVPAADHAERALAAAEDMMRFLETAAVEWRERYGTHVRLGVGVNSGEAIVGNIGSDKRMEYTVIGDVVNVAARLEALAQPNQVLVGGATYELAKDAYAMRLLGERKLTGRSRETKVYELDTA
jgi:class 3 adenylate cyclase